MPIIGEKMPQLRKILVVATAEDERLLYRRALTQTYPDATLTDCGTSTSALMAAEDDGVDAIVLHYNASPESTELLKALRRLKPAVPIVAISGIDRRQKALAHGATTFVLAQQFNQLGRVLQQHVEVMS